MTTIAGQGHKFIRGIIPEAQLLVATVVNSDGVAVPRSVADGIAWLMENGVKIAGRLVLPAFLTHLTLPIFRLGRSAQKLPLRPSLMMRSTTLMRLFNRSLVSANAATVHALPSLFNPQSNEATTNYRGE